MKVDGLRLPVENMKRSDWVASKKVKRQILNTDDELREKVHMAIGQAASVHWRASGEVFDSTQFLQIGNTLLDDIKRLR